MNKKGVTLIELLAYMSLVTIVILLFNGMMSYIFKSYDTINGKGAFYTEANNIMSLTLTKVNSFNPQYMTECGDNCLEFVVTQKRVIDDELGIIKYMPVDEVVRIEAVDRGEYYDLYLIYTVDGQVKNNIQLNSKKYGIVDYEIEGQPAPLLDYQCLDTNQGSSVCQRPVIYINLNMQALKNGKPVGEIYRFENKFAY